MRKLVRMCSVYALMASSPNKNCKKLPWLTHVAIILKAELFSNCDSLNHQVLNVPSPLSIKTAPAFENWGRLVRELIFTVRTPPLSPLSCCK
jgi:hypothetical protein